MGADSSPRGKRDGAAALAAENVPSLVDSAEQALHNWLAAGRYRQGDRLPPDHEVAAMLGDSRGTLRSALQRLEEGGEIVRRQGSGTFVGHTAIPTALDERLERLEPYSSVARRRGLRLSCVDLKIEHRAVGGEAGEALGLAPIAHTVAISRTLVANDGPVAVMFDVVHPAIELPPEEQLRDELEHGKMVLDVLIERGVPVTYARTRVIPSLTSPRERAGRLLRVRHTTPVLELEELIFAGRDERVAYSRDLFAPGGIDVMVVRSLESTRPACGSPPRAGRGARAAEPRAAPRPTDPAERPRPWRPPRLRACNTTFTTVLGGQWLHDHPPAPDRRLREPARLRRLRRASACTDRCWTPAGVPADAAAARRWRRPRQSRSSTPSCSLPGATSSPGATARPSTRCSRRPSRSATRSSSSWSPARSPPDCPSSACAAASRSSTSRSGAPSPRMSA